jgi:hypothetical protein
MTILGILNTSVIFFLHYRVKEIKVIVDVEVKGTLRANQNKPYPCPKRRYVIKPRLSLVFLNFTRYHPLKDCSRTDT